MQLNGQIRNTPPGVNHVGLYDRRGGTGVEAGGAAAAEVGVGLPDRRELRGGQDLAQQQPGAQIAADQVRVLEPMRHEVLYPFLNAARVVALPSLIDNIPNTCLEAMAHGRVVVATTGSCFEQLIVDGRSGLLIPPDNVAALSEAIARAWTMSAAQRQAMGQEAQRRIDQLRPQQALPRLMEYYAQVIRRFRGEDPGGQR